MRFSTRTRIAFFFAVLVFFLLGSSSFLLITSYHYEWVYNETEEMKNVLKKLNTKLEEEQKGKESESEDEEQEESEKFIINKEIRDFFDEEKNVMGKVISNSGNVIFASENFPNIPNIPIPGESLVIPEQEIFVFSGKLAFQNEDILIAEEVKDYLRQEKNLIQKAFLFSGMSTFLFFFIGYAFAWKILDPLRRITEKAKHISLSSLSLHIPPIGPKNDEIRILSETLNDLFVRLEKSADNLRKFTQDASHELRTPLTIIDSSLQLALKTQNIQHIKNARTELLNMQQLIDSLLLLAKSDRQVFPESKKEKINLKITVMEVLQNILPKFHEKKINVEIQIPEESFLFAEAESVKRIFWNILWNAYKFTPKNGIVSILYTQGKIEIANSGENIPEPELSSIFERFFRSETVQDTEGFGLGLAITKNLVEANGWEISVENKPKGVVFIIGIHQ